ncbi:MAG TPA: M28 family metallopeptidase [Geminicoccaceae bacterium]|nr:M28 family metallopeptidase [Geminicoccaceae bacterium]
MLGSTALAAVPTDSTNLRNALTVENIRAHQQALQEIADENDGTRASGTPGYDDSADYVAAQLEAAGYDVTRQPFTFPFFQELSDAEFEQVSPTAETYELSVDFLTMEYSGSGDVTAPVELAGGIQIPPGPTASSSSSGCTAADFTGFTTGNVALVQRGTCDFVVKAMNAEAAGASAVIIFNEGQEGRTDVLNGTLGGPGVEIPVIGTIFAVGEELYVLANGAGVTVRVATDTTSEIRNTENVIAESTRGRTDRVVVVGAHLDSVPEGPGINDNGSGAATILEIALQMANLNVRNQVRFAFWGAEESGLLGSEYYVSQLSKRETKDIAVNLNFDMLGSPNYVRFVYDGDGSDTPEAGPNGSGVVEDIFLDYFCSVGLETEPTAFDGRSDYGPFIAVGIPAGGLFSGAEGMKTEEEEDIYGGTAGVAYDLCYHQACDTYANVSEDALDELGDGAAHAVLQFATTTSAVKGTSRGNDRAVENVPAAKLAYRGHNLKK